MRQSSKMPIWLVLVAGILLLFAGYYFYHGAMNFLDNHGDIAAPIVNNTVQAALDYTSTAIPTIRINTSTPAKPCLDFRISVIKARVRECPKDSCNTLGIFNQYTSLCVWGDAPDAAGWYEVNLSPNDPIPQMGYVSQSVVKAYRPTPRGAVTQTATLALPTVTPTALN